MITEIDNAMNKNADKTEEEYAEETAKMDEAVEKHQDGNHRKYDGKPVSEATRHKRIQSNFYGTTVNFLVAILGEMQAMRAEISELKEKLDGNQCE